jgi:HEPN domain-containing protein
MKKRTLEWISKAEGDWTIAQRERQVADPVWDGICFLARQCAEKYLKAFKALAFLQAGRYNPRKIT